MRARCVCFFVSVVVGLMSACCLAQGGKDRAALVPISPPTSAPPPPGMTQFRGGHVFLLYMPSAGKLEVDLDCIKVGRYESLLHYTLEDPNGKELCAGTAPPGQSTSVAIDAQQPGPYRLRTDAGRNGYRVRAKCQYVTVEASPECPLHVISKADPLYFFVPPGTRYFVLIAQGSGQENVRAAVVSPAGKEIISASTVATGRAELGVSVPLEMDGKVWSLLLSKAEKGIFEDATVWFGGGVPAFFSPRPDGLVLPVFECAPVYVGSRKPASLPIRLGLTPQALSGASLSVRLRDAATGDEIAAADFADAAAPQLGLKPPDGLKNGEYELYLKLDARGTSRETRLPVYVANGLVFFGKARLIANISMPAGAPRRLIFHPNLYITGEPLTPVLRVINDDVGKPRTEAEIKLTGLREQEVKATLQDGLNRFVLKLLDGDRTIITQRIGALYRKGEALYTESGQPGFDGRPWESIARVRHGVMFVPEVVDAIPYDYLPKRRDLSAPLENFGALGQRVPVTFGFYCDEPLSKVRVEVSDLKARRGGGVIGRDCIEVRKALYWAQRTGWHSKQFRIVPEMLERFSAVELEPEVVHQFWLTVHIPPDARPGDYGGTVRVVGEGGQVAERELRLEVLPFALEHPEGKVWGLYSDSRRWKDYPDERVLAELIDIKQHGIDTLVMYPLKHSEISYENGRLSVDLTEFKKYMRLYMQAGLGGPVCMSFQGLDGVAYRLTKTKRPECTEEFRKVFTGIVKAVADCGKREGWPDAVYHFVDEPSGRNEKYARLAVMCLRLAKEAGFRTFVTAVDPAFTNEKLDPYLDVRCYSIGSSVVSAEKNRRAVEDCKKSGDAYWWYGSGSYIGQDGNAIRNRMLCGFVFAKSGATGQWSWTFQRCKDSPYSDFDGLGRREAKDACITYPARNAPELCTTLQWEGIREGVDDAKYVATLRARIEACEASGDESVRKKAARARAELDKLLDSVPWPDEPAYRKFNCKDCRQVRRHIARLIAGLESGED